MLQSIGNWITANQSGLLIFVAGVVVGGLLFSGGHRYQRHSYYRRYGRYRDY